MKSKSDSFSRYIVLFAVIIALTVIATTLPFVFLIPLLFVAVSFGFGTTMFTALSFGLISLGLSFVGGGTFVPLAFIENPLIPIIPRLLVGVTAFFTNFFFNKIIKKEGKLKVYLPKAASAVIGSLTNTIFVILFMYWLLPSSVSYGEYTLKAYTPLMIISGCIEVAVNVIAVPPLAIGIRRALRLTKYGEMLTGNTYRR